MLAAWEDDRVQAWLAVKDGALALAADAHLVAHGGPAESKRARGRIRIRVSSIIRLLDAAEGDSDG